MEDPGIGRWTCASIGIHQWTDLLLFVAAHLLKPFGGSVKVGNTSHSAKIDGGTPRVLLMVHVVLSGQDGTWGTVGQFPPRIEMGMRQKRDSPNCGFLSISL